MRKKKFFIQRYEIDRFVTTKTIYRGCIHGLVALFPGLGVSKALIIVGITDVQEGLGYFSRFQSPEEDEMEFRELVAHLNRRDLVSCSWEGVIQLPPVLGVSFLPLPISPDCIFWGDPKLLNPLSKARDEPASSRMRVGLFTAEL